MPQYNRAELGRMATESGFVRDTFEKVLRLKEIIKFLNEDKFLREHLLLKGGTAINLTVFNLPRLSVDIDMDYTPNDTREDMLECRVYMSTENSVNRSLKTRSLLTKFGTCSITATGAVTILLLFRSRFHCSAEFHGVCRNRLPYQSDKPCM